MSKIKVRAADGLRVFFPMRVKSAPGARSYVLEGSETLEVDGADRFVVKRIKVGDLIVVKETRKPKPAKSDKPKVARSED